MRLGCFNLPPTIHNMCECIYLTGIKYDQFKCICEVFDEEKIINEENSIVW